MSRFSRLLPSVGVLAIIACGAAPAFADTITVQSGNPDSNQSETCTIGSTTNSCVDITPSPVWSPNDPTYPGTTTTSNAQWVSYALTGAPPDNQPAAPGTTYSFTYTFYAPPNAQFVGMVWADDVANVYLDGLFVGGGTATMGGGAPWTSGYAISAPLGAGTPIVGGAPSSCSDCTVQTLSGTITQNGSSTSNASNPSGILVVGDVEVPEPATLSLFGLGLFSLGLFGVGAAQRRRDQV